MIVGLTGGIGCGKTTATSLFAEGGICIVDADLIAREVVQPGSKALPLIFKKFGESVKQDGQLNRAALRDRIFADAAAKTWLEQLLHPLINQEIKIQLQQSTRSYKILAAPLLFENQLQLLCSKTLLIDVSEKTQLARTIRRDGLSQDQIKAIIHAQMPREEKQKRADYVLDNNGNLAALKQQVVRFDKLFTALAKEYC